jgi:hypothetical protein
MVDAGLIVAGVSILINIILIVRIIQMKQELDRVKQSTRLTREEVQKLNERLGKLKSL